MWYIGGETTMSRDILLLISPISRLRSRSCSKSQFVMFTSSYLRTSTL